MATLSALPQTMDFYNSEEIKVIEPDDTYFDGLGLISSYRFSQNTNLIHYNTETNFENVKYIFIPPTVNKINNFAFLDCRNLVKVFGGKNVTEVGYGAFKNCTSLEQVDFLNRLRTIDNEAFRNCVKLDTYSTTHKIVSIGQHAFRGCTGLSKVHFLNSELNLPTVGFSAAFRDCSGIQEIIVPKGLENRMEFLFAGIDLTQIDITYL
jgi:hypothetical protein